MNLPSVQEMESYIRQAAQARGIDPDIAVRVARSEGLAPGVWQANGTLSYGRERSYGPFQLHVDPRPGKGGLGNAMLAQTGIDPSDPANWKQGVDFALDKASKTGWRDWFGAKAAGIDPMAGIQGAKAIGVQPAYTAGPGRGSVAGYRKPGTYSGGEFVPGEEKTFFADNSPLLPHGGAGTDMGGFVGGPSQVAARNPVIETAAIEGKGDLRPTNFQQLAARQAMEGDQSQRARLLRAAGLDPTGKTRITPRGTSSGILDKLGAELKGVGPKLDTKLAAIPTNFQNKLSGGILGKLFSLFS